MLSRRLKLHGRRILEKMGYGNIGLSVQLMASQGSSELQRRREGRAYIYPDELEMSRNFYVEINNRLNEAESFKTLEHELGHYYIHKKHPYSIRLLKIFQKPGKRLDRIVPYLSVYTSLGSSLLSLLFSIDHYRTNSSLEQALGSVLPLTTLMIAGPHLLEEVLADYIGHKYQKQATYNSRK